MRHIPLAVWVIVCSASPAASQGVTAPDTYFEFQVEQPAKLVAPFVKPDYPVALKGRGIEGAVRVQFIVDTIGRADTTSLKIFNTSDEAFSRAVLAVLPKMRFEPARLGGRKVKQVVAHEFLFHPPT